MTRNEGALGKTRQKTRIRGTPAGGKGRSGEKRRRERRPRFERGMKNKKKKENGSIKKYIILIKWLTPLTVMKKNVERSHPAKYNTPKNIIHRMLQILTSSTSMNNEKNIYITCIHIEPNTIKIHNGRWQKKLKKLKKNKKIKHKKITHFPSTLAFSVL